VDQWETHKVIKCDNSHNRLGVVVAQIIKEDKDIQEASNGEASIDDETLMINKNNFIDHIYVEQIPLSIS